MSDKTNLYRLRATGDVWELDHTEFVGNTKVFVFKNGERWATDLFHKHCVRVNAVETSPSIKG